MLYQVIHTHTSDTCPAQSASEMKRFNEWWQSLKASQGMKVLAGTVCPLEHTVYITVEADDYQALSRALWPLLALGTGEVIPVITLDQTIPMAESARTAKEAVAAR